MQKIIVKIPKTVMVEKETEVESVKFVSPSQDLGLTRCGACKELIGNERPIAIIWTEGRSMRLCNSCSSHLKEAP